MTENEGDKKTLTKHTHTHTPTHKHIHIHSPNNSEKKNVCTRLRCIVCGFSSDPGVTEEFRYACFHRIRNTMPKNNYIEIPRDGQKVYRKQKNSSHNFKICNT